TMTKLECHSSGPTILQQSLADQVPVLLVVVGKEEEVYPLLLLPETRGIAEYSEDVLLIGLDEAGLGRLGGEVLGGPELEVHLRPAVLEADPVQACAPPPPALVRKLQPADLQGVARAQNALEDVPHEEP